MSLSGNVQSEHVAEFEVFKQRYNRKLSSLFLCRPVLLSGNLQSEQVAAAWMVQETVKSET